MCNWQTCTCTFYSKRTICKFIDVIFTIYCMQSHWFRDVAYLYSHPELYNTNQLQIINYSFTQLLQPFYGRLSGTGQVSCYQKKHSPTGTYTYPAHQPSFINFLYLPWFMASSLLNLRSWQSFHTTSPSPLWSTSWSGTLHLIGKGRLVIDP